MILLASSFKVQMSQVVESHGKRSKYLGLEVKDMVGDCKVVFQPAQEGTVSFLPIMMRIEDTKCYDDVEDVLLHIIL